MNIMTQLAHRHNCYLPPIVNTSPTSATDTSPTISVSANIQSVNEKIAHLFTVLAYMLLSLRLHVYKLQRIHQHTRGFGGSQHNSLPAQDILHCHPYLDAKDIFALHTIALP